MKFLKINEIGEIKKDIIFKIAKMAMDAKKAGHHVYNASLGTLYNEDLTFTIHNTFYDAFDEVERLKKASYTPQVDGGLEFATALKKWVFQNHDFLQVSEVVATPGGSGALSSCFNELVAPKDQIIIPDIFWSPYEIIMEAKGVLPKKCSCFENGEFTLENIKKAMLEVAKTQNNVVVVMNDPCHNPTGYSMGKAKWQEFIDFTNTLAQGDTTVSIINDIAYIDYCRDFEHSRDYMEAFKTINDNVLVVFAFSGSKTLTAYGMRAGAAIVYANQETDRKNVHTILTKVARGTWSNSNHGALETMIEVFNNHELFKAELKKAATMLGNRTAIFKQEADKVGLKYYPSMEGFFITLVGIENRNYEIYEKLKAKHIYVVPMEKGLRVAICSLPVEQCAELPAMIQATIEELQ